MARAAERRPATPDPRRKIAVRGSAAVIFGAPKSAPSRWRSRDIGRASFTTMRRLSTLLLLSFAGCANQRPMSYVPAGGSADKTPEEAFNERWAGQSEDDVLVHYGKPSDILPLSTGNRVDSYHSEVTTSTASSRGAFSGSFGGHRSSAQTVTVYCDRRFEIDKTTMMVVTWRRCGA
jgi:hypothetical protein